VLYTDDVVPIIRDIEHLNTKITVLVTDEDGLRNIKTLQLPIEIGKCPPKILSLSPAMDCLI
jgi:hypothetical protein